LRAIQTEVSMVRWAAPILRTNAQVLSEDQNWSTSVQGTTPDYFDIRNWPMARGQRFSESDDEAGRKVAILGSTVSEKLFGASADPVGQVVRIKNIPFEIVAVAATKGQSPQGQDFDDAVFIPATTFRAKIQGGLINFIAGVVF